MSSAMFAELTNLTGIVPITSGRIVFSDAVSYLFFRRGDARAWYFQTLNPIHRKTSFPARGTRLRLLISEIAKAEREIVGGLRA